MGKKAGPFFLILPCLFSFNVDFNEISLSQLAGDGIIKEFKKALRGSLRKKEKKAERGEEEKTEDSSSAFKIKSSSFLFINRGRNN